MRVSTGRKTGKPKNATWMEGINALNLESGVAGGKNDGPTGVPDASGALFVPIFTEKDARSVTDLLFEMKEEESGSKQWAEANAPALASKFGEPTVSNYESCQQLFELRRQLASKRPAKAGQQMMQQGVPMYPPNGMNGMMPQMGMSQMPMANPQMGNMPPQMVGGAPMNMNGMQGMAPMQGGMPAQMPDMAGQGPQNAAMMGPNQTMNMGQPMSMQAPGGPVAPGPMAPGPGGPQGQMGPGGAPMQPGGPAQMAPNQMQGNQMPMQGGQMQMNMGYPMNYGNMPYGMQNSGMPMEQQGYMMMNQGMGYGQMPNQMQGNWQQGPQG
jgi:hypothetical protein